MLHYHYMCLQQRTLPTCTTIFSPLFLNVAAVRVHSTTFSAPTFIRMTFLQSICPSIHHVVTTRRGGRECQPTCTFVLWRVAGNERSFTQNPTECCSSAFSKRPPIRWLLSPSSLMLSLLLRQVFFLYFTLFHVYFFSFPFGFSYVALVTTVLFLQHSMLFFWNRYEVRNC